jgi:hypothetical protein
MRCLLFSHGKGSLRQCFGASWHYVEQLPLPGDGAGPVINRKNLISIYVEQALESCQKIVQTQLWPSRSRCMVPHARK